GSCSGCAMAPGRSGERRTARGVPSAPACVPGDPGGPHEPQAVGSAKKEPEDVTRGGYPPSAVFTLRSVSRSLLSPSTCCCISTMLEPSCPTEPSAPPCSPAFFMTSPSWASALRCPSEPHRYPAPKMPATATMRSPRPIRPWSISSSLRVSHALALLRDVVDQQVLAQPVR